MNADISRIIFQIDLKFELACLNWFYFEFTEIVLLMESRNVYNYIYRLRKKEIFKFPRKIHKT